MLGCGLAAALVVCAIPFTRFVLSAMVTLFHELGHYPERRIIPSQSARLVERPLFGSLRVLADSG